MTSGRVPGRPSRLVRVACAVACALVTGVVTGVVSADDRVSEEGGYLEIGAAWRTERSILARPDEGEARDPSGPAWGVSFAGALRLDPVFLEGRRGGLDGVSLGVTLHRDERHALELLAVHVPGGIEELGYGSGYEVDALADERSRDASLLNRNDLFGTSGLRYREYRGDALLQASAVVDWQHGNGVLLGAHAGRQWQLGNWTAQAVAGLRWASADLVDFLYGVDADEATTRFPAYRGRGTPYGEAIVGLVRPLARHVVLRASARARLFGAGVTDSPLVASDTAYSAETGIAYVF